MKCSSPRLGPARRLTALSVSIALLISGHVLAFSASAKTATARATTSDSADTQHQLSGITATVTAGGILLRWRTNSAPDNLGFNVYRVKNGERTRANGEIIPGALFSPGTSALRPGGYSYSWLDRTGSADAIYFIESVTVDGVTTLHEPVIPAGSKTNSEFRQTAAAAGSESLSAGDLFTKSFPAVQAQQSTASTGTIQEQWAIAAQPALKIAIKKDGWYRVTQTQMAAAGFNPSVDIRNLRLFIDANEVAISTSQSSGLFGSGDYIEFYGQGLDTQTTDTRVYYLIAGNSPGKRVIGELKGDGDPDLPPATPSPTVVPTAGPDNHPLVFRNPIFFSWVLSESSAWTQLEILNKPQPPALDRLPAVELKPRTFAEPIAPSTAPTLAPVATADVRNNEPLLSTSKNTESAAGVVSAATASPGKPATESAAAPAMRRSRKQRGSRKRKAKRTRQPAIQRNHAALADNFSPANFEYTTQIKERIVYLSNLLNGETENFFGRVISTNPVNQTLVVPNPELGTAASLEFALQGVQNQSASPHLVNVSFNGVQIGSVSFGALEHPIRTIAVPQVQSGNNTVTFTKVSTGEVCIVDYIKLTYRHRFAADSNSLKFNLRGSQTVAIDGFATPLVQLIDYTDPLNVQLSKAAAEVSNAGYAITVPTTASRSKDQRLLYALPLGQFDQPASLSLNQASTLNLNTNAANFLVIAHKSLLASLTPLLALRQSQGMSTAIVDVEDVYDEFGYGLHGPQAIKDFLQYAVGHWATPPRYVIFAGDATNDPRGYEGLGDFDLVPTKLIDATFSETASDDWLADFDNDGTADIPIGRLPFKNVADADKIIDKIVHFIPASFPEAALLIADDPGTPPLWDFETSSDAVQQLLPPAVTVQRVNVRIDGPAQAKINLVNGFNAGRSVVNYSGHGSVDVWSGASIFNSSDAVSLTNGNKLSFVIVMDCLNGYYLSPSVVSLAEALLKAPNGGAVAAFASSGLTITPGQRQMELELYRQLYGATPIALGDAIKLAKNASSDPDVRSTWIYFGDPSIKIR
jgi:Peptidase family C25